MESVSVYITCYNGEHFLHETLPAVAAQEYPIEEIVIVDDGSLPALAIPLPNTPPTRIVRHPHNLGVAASRNTALKEIRSDLVMAFDADIVPEPNCLSILVASMARNPRLSGAGGRVTERYTETLGDLLRARYMRQDRGEEALANVDLFGGCTLYRRSALIEVGGYSEMLRNSFEDFDLSRRILARGGQTLYVPTARAHHSKRDTLISALDTMYRWSYPHWESNPDLQNHNWLQDGISYPIHYYEQTISSQPETLEYKLRQDLDLAKGRLTGCDDRQLLYPLILYPVRSILLDLINYRTCQGVHASEMIELSAEVLAALLQHYIAPNLSVQLECDSFDLLEKLYGASLWQEQSARQRTSPSDILKMLDAGVVGAPPLQTFVERYSEMVGLYVARTKPISR